MSRFMFRRGENKDASLLHVLNFLISCEVMSFENSRPLFRAFHLNGEDVVVDIPNELDCRFRTMLDTVKFRYEKI